MTSSAQIIVDAKAALDAASKALNMPMPESAKVLVLGVVAGENFFGRLCAEPKYQTAAFLATAGSNDWGNFDVNDAATHFRARHWGKTHFGEMSVGDSHANGQGYTSWRRMYPNQLEAAKDWLQAWYARIKLASATDAATLAANMKATGYYETSVANYTQMILGNLPPVQHALASGLKPADPAKAGADEVAGFVSRRGSAARLYTNAKAFTAAELSAIAKALNKSVPEVIAMAGSFSIANAGVPVAGMVVGFVISALWEYFGKGA